MRCLALSCVLLLSACPAPPDDDSSLTTTPPLTGSTNPGTQTGSTTQSESTETATATATATTGTTDPDSGSDDIGPLFDIGLPDQGGEPEPLPLPQLWYCIADRLVYIELDQADGSVAQLVTSTITNEPPLPFGGSFSSITMLDDGSLLGARGLTAATTIFHIPTPPTVATDLEVTVLGELPGIYIEALYTDCDGRVYLMDTGVDVTSSTGNRLIRFTENYLAGDFTFEVITDLSVAVAADIDDMAPGIDPGGAIMDNPGFAIDSGTLYDFNYTTGTGMALGMAGTYGVHALGGALFDDGVSRLYVTNLAAELFEVDPITLVQSEVLVTGPMLPGGNSGLAGITGPLTDCRSGFPEG